MDIWKVCCLAKGLVGVCPVRARGVAQSASKGSDPKDWDLGGAGLCMTLCSGFEAPRLLLLLGTGWDGSKTLLDFWDFTGIFSLIGAILGCKGALGSWLWVKLLIQLSFEGRPALAVAKAEVLKMGRDGWLVGGTSSSQGFVNFVWNLSEVEVVDVWFCRREGEL